MIAADLHEPLAQRIGPYEVLLDIGSGGMGTISLARATGDPLGVGGFARLVALKRPLGALASDPEVMQRFLDEARLLAQIHHANVVGIHQIGSDAEGHFLVLDYIEGGTLDELLTRTILHRKKLPPEVVLRILGDVLAGLHGVHEAADVEGRPLQMLHRDISAQNVLVGKDGVSRVADFGIAKAIISSTVTDKPYLQGRIPYMAPEYLRREAVDRRLDVYAAGVTMWTALAGRMPWGDAGEAQMVKNIVLDGVPSLSNAGVTIAPAIEAIVARACARDPAVRYASAGEMLAAIEDLGRKTGGIASHAEVAVLVEELLGLEIRARRAAIARRLASPEARGEPRGGSVRLPSGQHTPSTRSSREGGQSVMHDVVPFVPSRESLRSDLTPTFIPSARSLPTPARGHETGLIRSGRSPATWVMLAILAATIAMLVWRWGPSTPSLASPTIPAVPLVTDVHTQPVSGLGAPPVTDPAPPSTGSPSLSASAERSASAPTAVAPSTANRGPASRPAPSASSRAGVPAALPTAMHER